MDNEWISKLRQRWGLRDTRQVIFVLAVFSLTGSATVYMRRWIMVLTGLDQWEPSFLTVTLSLVLCFILYQVLLLAFSIPFGLFEFFWNFEKRTVGRLSKLIPRKSPSWRLSVSSNGLFFNVFYILNRIFSLGCGHFKIMGNHPYDVDNAFKSL